MEKQMRVSAIRLGRRSDPGLRENTNTGARRRGVSNWRADAIASPTEGHKSLLDRGLELNVVHIHWTSPSGRPLRVYGHSVPGACRRQGRHGRNSLGSLSVAPALDSDATGSRLPVPIMNLGVAQSGPQRSGRVWADSLRLFGRDGVETRRNAQLSGRLR